MGRTGVLLLAACCFALASGVNDGGALVALGLRVPVFRPVMAIGILAVMVAVAPFVVGTSVASTLARKLAPFGGEDGRTAVFVAIVGSLVVVGVLVRLELPTSLTLATIGALVGASVELGLQVDWSTVGAVMLVGALGPFVGAGVARGVTAGMGAVSGARLRGVKLVRVVHVVGYGVECFAYGTNDGQRMLAVFAIALAGRGAVQADGRQLAAIGLLFAMGAVVGMYRFSGTLGVDFVPTRPHDAAAAEVAAATASLGGALVGAPLSITQAVSGGLVGSGGAHGWRRIRWARATRLALAWVLTLPSSFLAAWLFAAAANAVM
jgi:PiT family inorganic phosphate transporter